MEYPHIFLSLPPLTSKYSAVGQRSSGPKVPERDRGLHSKKLLREYNQLWAKGDPQMTHGIYVEFSGGADHDLLTKSLENRKSGIRLRNIQITSDNEGVATQHATIYIPANKKDWFPKKLTQYALENTKKDKPKNDTLVRSVECIRAAVLGSFWTDDPELKPLDSPHWCEAWLSSTEEEEVQQFQQDAEALHIQCSPLSLSFPERTVTLIYTTAQNLIDLIGRNPNIAEFRAVHDPVHFFMNLENKEQREWVANLASRIESDESTNISICLLDTGVNNGHILLAPFLSNSDLHAFDSNWGVHDNTQPHQQHGTLVSGIAVYGDLSQILSSNAPVVVKHCLESVKILPPWGGNQKNLYGFITAQALSRVEISQPDRTRIACLTITTDEQPQRGRPSSWSAAIDQLASGAEDGVHRLFVISAGNVHEQADWHAYPHSNITKSVQDPGQSWNALTVGAYTQKATIADPEYKSYKPLAEAGQLSPYSTTTSIWEKGWPFKPDIVLEGGNVAMAPDGFMGSLDDLSLLTTGGIPTVNQFSLIHATSAATALAARMAAQIQAQYPKAWPETVRALIIHSSQWPTALVRQFTQNDTYDTLNKSQIAQLMRICGFGVPDLQTALMSKANLLTLVGEYQINPFTKTGQRYTTNEMHIHALPWPKETLLELGETRVILRITLSYFIEPGPGEIGKKNKYRYLSHGFSFDLNTPGETKQEFLKRLNVAARSEESAATYESLSGRWTIGKGNRSKGSIQSDIWHGTAADLASSNMIGIYPIIGWWRERYWLNKWNKRARYTLVVSLHTPEEHMDVYTPVAIQVKTPTLIST